MNNMNKKKTNGRKNKNKNRRGRNVNNKLAIESDYSFPLTVKYGTMQNPGRSRTLARIDVDGTVQQYRFGYSQFNNWTVPTYNTLNNFQFWRLENVRVSAFVSGGSASSYTIAFNVSNDSVGDSVGANIMNDDYAAIANGTYRASIQPPRGYWRQTTEKWYPAINQVSVTSGGFTVYEPSMANYVNGIITVVGAGGAITSTAVGFLMVEIDYSFHTLI